MKVKLIAVSKKDEKPYALLHDMFEKRLGHYLNFEYCRIQPSKHGKNETPVAIKSKEAELISKYIDKSTLLVTLDEHGKSMGSKNLAKFIEQAQVRSTAVICFVIGGAFGIDKSILSKANFSLSLSKFTMPHALARIVFLEQLYRAMTIIRNEKYHNE